MMSSILLKSRNTFKNNNYIMILLLLTVSIIWGCFPKNVTHEIISKDSQYIPEDMAKEYLNNFVDITSEGILLEKGKKGFTLENIYERFPLKDTSFMAETYEDKYYTIMIKHKYNPEPHLIGFHKQIFVEGIEKVKKISTALLSLGATIE